jgi:hypothetical protein
VYGERSKRVKDAQYLLKYNRFGRHFYTGDLDSIFGEAMYRAAEEARFELGFPMISIRRKRYGAELHSYLLGPKREHGSRLPLDFQRRRLARKGKRFIAPNPRPPLPAHVHFPGVYYPPTHYAYGLQPWIAPQVIAIAKHFGLTVTAGHGGHPPHAYYSDHRWGGACDLAGSYDAMVRCTLWADKLCSGYYHSGVVFRWVGGPAHDWNGVEPGHYNHFHGSWFRNGPATTCLRADGSLKGT